MTRSHRMFIGTVAVAAVVSAGMFARTHGSRDTAVVQNPRVSLDAGRRAAALWIIEANGAEVSARSAIAVGYMERLRLGLGSPFRLIDYALRDPRLDDSTRVHVAWALLARTLDGQAYDVDAAALDRAGANAIPSWPGIGARHLALIAEAIDKADDPRTGELAVRLGYALAATEGSLPAHAPRYAANAAALIRDRALAMQDARDIVRMAAEQQIDALQLVKQRRTQHELRVEAPALAQLPQEDERAALSDATHIASELRALGADVRNITMRHPDTTYVHATLLRPAAAQKLAALADNLSMPPLAPLVVGARSYDHELTVQPWLDAAERTRRRGLESAGSEERFVARYARIDRTGPYDVVPSLVATWSAVGMRALAQETVWYPGDAGPTSRELTQKYGLRSVSFGASVPTSWRPYYRRMIDIALSDMRLVLPALDVRGLSIRFQELGRDEGTLALHDPQHRRLLLPPSTAAGTLAHEITHDLDWQVALRRYHTRGDYASDRSMRTASSGRSDRLALRMQDLAAGSTLPESASPALVQHAHRPTEILARNVDFFIAVSLAERGLTDGYLSSVQDELLTGYGTVRAPELTGVAADALVTILDEVAPAYPETRNWFLRRYGTGRTLRSYDLVRRVIENKLPMVGNGPASSGAPELSVFESIVQARDAADRSIDAWTCRVPDGSSSARLEEARRTVVREAALARARGYAIRRARMLMGRNAARWVAGQLNGGPWHIAGVTPEMEVYLSDLVSYARAVGDQPKQSVEDGFRLSSPPARCDAVERPFYEL